LESSWLREAVLFRALSFTITRGKIVQIDVIADPARFRQLDLAVVND